MGRQVKTHKHTHQHQQQHHQQQHFSKYKHTMKFTGLIASTLMLLLAVMASTASARSIAFPEPQNCCRAYTAKCMSCSEGVTVEEICRVHEEDMALDSYLQPLEGCPKKPKKCC